MTAIPTLLKKKKSIVSEVAIVFGASIILSLFAKVSIPLFFTPVPLIVQNNLLLLMALLLGKNKGFSAAFLFIIYGAIGLPVFAGGGGGISIIFGPTGGYIIGYLCAAYLVGFLSDRVEHKTPLKAFSIMALGSIVIMTCGCVGLSFWVGWEKTLFLGIVPFVPGNLLKTFICTRLAKTFKWIENESI